MNAENLRIRRSCILVSNHPNTLLDPLHVASMATPYVFFLANSSLFNHWLSNWVLSRLYCIPIQRQQDIGGRVVHNSKSFERCDAFLNDGGCLYIAPEGSSYMEKKLREIKTGTARIALSASQKGNFTLDLIILPVGLHYTAPNRFRSQVLLNVGEPIEVSKYKAQYKADPTATVHELTEEVRQKLSELILNTQNEGEEYIIDHIDELQQNEEPLTLPQRFVRSKHFLQNLRRLPENQYQRLKNNLENYFELLRKYEIRDKNLIKKSNFILAISLIILAFPMFLYGLVHNVLPVSIGIGLVKRLKMYVGYDSSIKYLSGLLSFPFFYWLQVKLWKQLLGVQFSFMGCILAFSWVFFGILAWHYVRLFRDTKAAIRVQKLTILQKTELLFFRNEILENGDLIVNDVSAL